MTWSRRRSRPCVPCTAVHRGGGVVRALACAVLALLCGARPVRADHPAIPIPRLAATGSVHAGDLVEIRWNALPPGVDEMELMLSVDGGRHYPIRVTAEMSGRETSFVWRVPNLGARAARLRLRAHHHGREIESAAGNDFQIVSDPSRPAELEQVHEGGWWNGLDEIDGDTGGLSGARPSFHRLSGGATCETPRRDRHLLTPTTASDPAPLWSAARAETQPALLHSAVPLFRPRRE